jgi:hypothetical protein
MAPERREQLDGAPTDRSLIREQVKPPKLA